MIKLYGFGKVFKPVIGETRDLRALWAIEEMGLPYVVHPLDHSGGELSRPPYTEMSPFKLAPIIDDEGFIVAESGAILLYLAEKSGKLIPHDFKGRTQVSQWCFSALNTIERPMLEIMIIDKFGKPEDAARRENMIKQAHRWLSGLEARLQTRQWIAVEDFSVADILLVSVLRQIRKTDLVSGYPQLKAYYERSTSRPAWKKTLKLYAERLGVSLEEVS